MSHDEQVARVLRYSMSLLLGAFLLENLNVSCIPWWFQTGVVLGVRLYALTRIRVGVRDAAIGSSATVVTLAACAAFFLDVAEHLADVGKQPWIDILIGVAHALAMASLFRRNAHCCRLAEFEKAAMWWRLTNLAWITWYALLLPLIGSFLVLKDSTNLSITHRSGFMFICIGFLPVVPYAFALAAFPYLEGSRSCRNCRYDLVGTPGGKCPECGMAFAHTISPAPSVVWPRRAITLLIATSCFASMLLGIVVFLEPGRAVTHKPTALLLRDAKRVQASPLEPMLFAFKAPRPTAKFTTAGAEASQAELLKRVQSGRCTEGDGARIVDHILTIQADLDQQMGAWPQIFEAAIERGLVSDGQRRRYFENMMQFELQLPARVRTGSPLGFKVHVHWRGIAYLYNPKHFPPRHQLDFPRKFAEITVQSNDEVLLPVPSPDTFVPGSTADFRFYELSDRPLVRTPPGLTNISVHLRRTLTPRSSDDEWGLDRFREEGFPLTQEIALTSTIQVVAADEPTIRTTTVPPSLLKDAIAASRVKYSPNSRPGIYIHSVMSLDTDIIVNVLSVVDGEEVLWGSHQFPKNEFPGIHNWLEVPEAVVRSLETTGATSVELLLRPSLAEAETFPDLHEVWLGPEETVEVRLVEE